MSGSRSRGAPRCRSGDERAHVRSDEDFSRALDLQAMSRILIIAGVIVGGTLIWWFAAGSSLVGLVDRITTTPVDSMAPVRFAFDEGNDATFETPKFTVGDRQRAATAWRVAERSDGRLSLETKDGSFVFGLLTRRESRGGDKHRYDFVADSGDVVSLTRSESRLSWPRPLVINWLGGPAARWVRHVYFRLVWRKPSGDVLDVVWRDQKRFQEGSGWADQYLPTEPVTRLSVKSR